MTALTDRFTRAIVKDLEYPSVGMTVFDRFTGCLEGTLGYYESLVRTQSARGVKVAPVLEAIVGRMHHLAGVSERRPL